MKRYKIEQKPWVLETYSKRSLWAQAYLRGYMFAGASSTQRVEGMNAYFNQFLKQRLRLFEFMVHYERALGRIRNREAKAEVRTENSFSVLTTPLKRLEKHGADMFTRNIFLLFRDELNRAGKYIVEKTIVIEGIDHHKYYLSKYGSPEKTWTVDYHPAENRMMCSCLKFESFGIPCCHIICVMKLNHVLCIP